jgi:hypothetical protein
MWTGKLYDHDHGPNAPISAIRKLQSNYLPVDRVDDIHAIRLLLPANALSGSLLHDNKPESGCYVCTVFSKERDLLASQTRLN